MLMLSRHLPSTRTLQCYLAVAQELNFRKAAQLLNMSQPPLTRQIQGLEELLRVQLIERDTRRVSLTPAGEAFKHEAHQFLVALDQAVLGMRERFHADDDSAASVRVGLTSVINFALIPSLDGLLKASGFAAARPLERALSRQLVERVCRGELDIAIVGDIIAPSADLSVESVGCEPMLIVLPDRHPAAADAVVDLRALGDTPLFWFPRADNPAFYDKCERTFKTHGYAPPRRPEPKDFASLLARVAAGEGVALAPESMRATSHVGVSYRALPAKLARLLAIEVQIVARSGETRRAVLEQIDCIRAGLAHALP